MGKEEEEEEVMGEALRLLHSCTLLPRLVVFDLDYTLWPFWCECRSKKENPSLYPEAMGILNALKQKGVTMAVASRTPTPDIANCFLNKLGIPSFFADMQIYPSYTHKVEHFQKIRQNTGIPYKSMLFFDDESRNIQSVSQLGVTSMLVEDGVNLKALEQGLQHYAESGTAV
jgi:magnesium-dependent phosphatase 1